MLPETMRTTAGSYTLDRIPFDAGLRAWDAADEYVLEAVGVGDGRQPVLIVNDGFGALTCALAADAPTVWTDSHVAMTAIRENMSNNNLDTSTVSIAPIPEVPTESQGTFGTIIIKIPKSLMLLEHQLRAIRPHLSVTLRSSELA